MVERRFLQERIILSYYDTKKNSWIEEIIRAETVKVTKKQDTTELTASDSVEPYAISFGNKTYEIQLSSIDPDQKDIFHYVFAKQAKSALPYMPNLTTYYYDEITGATTAENKFRQVYITEFDEENHSPFDVKMSALKIVD